MHKNLTKLAALISYIVFVFSIFKSAAYFYDEMYFRWITFFLSGILSYKAYILFINSLDEKDDQ